MKNVLSFAGGVQTLLANVDDGTNRIFINESEIASSLWVGSGTYTTTIDGVTISIAKIADLSGNIMLQKVSDNSYRLVRAEEPIVSGGIYYGTCTTAAATAAKEATVNSDFTLAVGVTVAIKFSYNNTYSATATSPITLNVNGTGAKNIYYAATATPTGTNTTPFGRANYVNTYVYDGSYWVWQGSSGDNNTTYSVMSTSEATTGTATASRVVRADYLNAAIKSIANPIGKIIHTSTCDTMAKVIAEYGGTTWIQHDGYMLRGASSGVTANSAAKDGGADTVKLTAAQSGVAQHTHAFTQPSVTGGSHNHQPSDTDASFLTIPTSGDGIARRTVSSGSGATQQYYGPQSISRKASTSSTSHTHTVSGGAVGNTTAAAASEAHNNLPSYKDVYIWERTA